MWKPWPTESPKWSQELYEDLTKTGQLPDEISLQQVMVNSDKFPLDFPIESVRCKSLIPTTPENILERNINSAYPVIHEQAVYLFLKFLEHKRKFGTDIEKEIYEGMTLEMLVERLLRKRAVCFVGPYDRYMLLDGVVGSGSGKWELVGTQQEEEPLTLKNCLSYDEIKLSALLSVSSYTQFINLGDRLNGGVIEKDKKKIEDDGIIVGLVGARFQKDKMEQQETIITKKQNVPENGYGNTAVPTTNSIFFDLYGEANLTYDQMLNQFKDTVKFTQIEKDVYFNNMVHERRLALSIDTFLIEANERAKAVGKMAYLHVVGIGLGAWRISPHQNKIFMNTFAKRIEFLSSLCALNNIDAICFSYIFEQSCGQYKHGDIIPVENHPNGGITILIVDRNPHEKLKHPFEDCLLVVSYAWNSNAFPGNDFWWGLLASSGDPAAASSTQIAELHNPYINPVVCGANLRIATLTDGLLTLKEYQDRMRMECNKQTQV